MVSKKTKNKLYEHLKHILSKQTKALSLILLKTMPAVVSLSFSPSLPTPCSHKAAKQCTKH